MIVINRIDDWERVENMRMLEKFHWESLLLLGSDEAGVPIISFQP